MNALAAKNRPQVIDKFKNKKFDLIIIGGGVTGAGIALDAASRGMSVALLEKKDFAAGTSSKSTKLIHGGLRYLKQFEVKLVREVGLERATVHKIAPHLVLPEKMLLPLTEDGTFGKIGTSIGLKVYDMLADVKGDDRRVMLGKEATMEAEPLLRTHDLKGSGLYAEYRTDDARLTLELIKTAAKYGALSLNYISATDFNYDENKKIESVNVKDELTDETFTMQSEYVVSAAGPWVDTLREKDKSMTNKHLFLSKGVHIVVPHDRLPLKQSVYFDIPDGRMMFAIPRLRVTYLGTTDTPYKGDINRVLANTDDVDYLLDATNKMFPDVDLTIDDVESSWAGLRPLIFEEGKSGSEMSRKDEIFESKTGLVSIAGGKLTGYRKMAERIVDLIAEKFDDNQDREFKDCHTRKIPLAGGDFADYQEVLGYQSEIEKYAEKLGLDGYYGRYLVANYGNQSDEILTAMENYDDEPNTALLRAELDFCLKNELTMKPMDFLNRRTGRLYFNIKSIAPSLDAILADFQKFYDWSDAETEAEKAVVLQEIEDVSVFYAPEAV